MSKIKSIIKTRKVVNSITKIDRQEWESVSVNKNIYLSIEYLQSIESALKSDMDFYYAISYDEKEIPVLASAFQVANFVDKRVHSENYFKCLVSTLKSKLFSFNVIVCGNVFSDGENGFQRNEMLSKRETIQELEVITRQVQTELIKKGEKVNLFLFKEFWSKENNFGTQFKGENHNEFMVDVNMVLTLRKEWGIMEDYLSSLKKKYRSRARSVYKKAGDLELRELSETEILEQATEIQQLFDNVAEKSEFSFGRMKADGFANLKKSLKDKFIFRAAFYENKMVGFSTSLINGEVLEASCVGIDYSFNGEKEIYQRLLYDFIDQAIQRKSKELHLGRTSELIKSAFGAVPENMNLYAKHSNRIHNIMLKPIFHFVAPSKFELRQPFKIENAS